MARSAAGAELVEQHRRQQLALRAVTAQQLMELWPIWNPVAPASWEPFASASTVLVQARSRDSAGLAAAHYTAYRTAEGVPGSPSLRLADLPDPQMVRTSLEVTARAQLARSLRSGMFPDEARQNALVTVTGAVTRHALNGGRETLIGSVNADPQAGGWQRVTGGRPCAFCAMLSSRGPVYRQGTADFQAHDHCLCTVEVVYPGGEWNEQNLAHRDMWHQAQNEVREAGELERGTSNDALNAFRRFLSA